MKWEVLEKQKSFNGYFQIDRYRIRLERFAGGQYEIDREVFERGSAVAVLPYDPQLDQLLLVEQFRAGALYADNPWLIEPVAGIIEVGELAEDVARRETLEEAGCRVDTLIPMFACFVTPGGSTEHVDMFCAPLSLADFTNQTLGGLELEGEDIRVHKVSRTTALHWLEQGKVKSLYGVAAIQWLALNAEKIQQRFI